MRTALIVAALGLMAATPVLGAASSTAKAKGMKPDASPGWIVVEDDVYYPLRFEAAEALHNARVEYRRDEEQDAATQVDKAVSWLKFAAGHGYPETASDLKNAADNLTTLASDLREGKITDAAQVDSAIAKAEHTLALWHYFKADRAFAKDELKWAAQDLDAAARYLQNAADSAHYEYGDGTVTVFESIKRDGKTTSSSQTYDRDQLASHLHSMKTELDKMSGVLKKDAA